MFWVGLILVLFLSGLVAYVGDRIGMWVGRKRRTIFGLRPRRTAALFTILTGVLIALLAIGIVLAASQDVRNRVLHYHQQLDSINAELSTTVLKLQKAEGSVKLAQQQLNQATADVTQAEKAKQAADQRAASAARQADVKATELQAAQAKVRQATNELLAARRRREEAVHRLATAERGLTQLEHSVAERGRELKALQGQISEAQRIFKKAEGDYTRLGKEWVEQVKKLDALGGELDQLKAAMERTNADLETARRERGELLDEALRAAKGKIIYDRDGELGRRRIEGGLKEAEVRDRLDTFLRELDRTAREQGAGEDSAGRCAVPLHIDEAGRTVPQDVFLPVVADRLAARGDPVWVRAVVLLNTVAGRPVYYAFEYYFDRVVFLKDTVIDSAVLDGSQDEATIIRGIEALKRDKVEATALKLGMLPNPERLVGPEVWFPALRQIKELGREVTVEALAARDIRIGDPLAVTFRVRDDVGP